MTAAAPFVAAAVQAEPCWLDVDAGVEKAAGLIAEAAANDARLVAFPARGFPVFPPSCGWGRGLGMQSFSVTKNSITLA